MHATHVVTRTSCAMAVLSSVLVLACREPRPELRVEARSATVQQRSPAPAVDPLPSWRAGPTKSAITGFVARVSRRGSPDFVAVADRIAVFDNDGTLWVEQPIYAQLAFAIDRVEQLAPAHPEWRTRQPFAAILDGDLTALSRGGHHALAELLAATHANMTTDAFARVVAAWLASARHPTLHRPYTDLAYVPMLELLAYLRANGFSTFIVSGGGTEFMRQFSERVYGVRRDQVVGSRIELRYEVRAGTPVLMRLPAVNFVDDGPGKPVGIQQAIGRRPIAAFGNSDGDLEMLDWVTSGAGPRLGVLVHHTDSTREWAYDRTSRIGRLSRALDAAAGRGWVVVDMKRDWARVFRAP